MYVPGIRLDRRKGGFRYDRFDNDGHEVDSLYVPEGYYSSIEEIVEIINSQILKAAGAIWNGRIPCIPLYKFETKSHCVFEFR